MSSKRSQSLIVPALTFLVLAMAVPVWPQKALRGAADVWGPSHRAPTFQPASPLRHASPQDTLGRLVHWNEVAINSSGLDHTPVPVGDPRIFGEQIGPARASRAIAIVHVAIFEAINAIKGGYHSYVGIPPREPEHVGGRRDRAGGARYAERALPLSSRRLQRPARGGPRADQGRTPEGGRHRTRSSRCGGDARFEGRRSLAASGAPRRHRLHHE